MIRLPRRSRHAVLSLAVGALLSGTAMTFAAPFLATSAVAAEQATAEDAKLSAFLDEVWQRNLDRFPTLRTQLGLAGDHSRWVPASDAFAEESAELTRKDLERMRREIDRNALSDAGLMNYRMFEYVAEDGLRAASHLYDTYPFTRLDGPHTNMPTLLASVHAVNSIKDAEDYISRLKGMPQVLREAEAAMQRRVKSGVVPPAFNFPPIAESSRAVVRGAPFDDTGADSLLWADFKGKVAALDADEAEKKRLLDSARAALLKEVKPAYTAYADAMEAIGRGVTGNHGIWAVPKGAEIYRDAIRHYTTVDHLDADKIHDLGLREVARIQEEMRGIMRQVGFKGDLKAFFDHLKTDPSFYYPDTEEGRQAYLAQATKVIETMSGKLDEYFGVKPKAPIEVRPVEKFRENSAPGAFYESPSLDGTRPAIFYANMADMKGLPKWDLETLAYHEGIPGHHMQLAIAQELTGVPEFRKVWFTSAYGEGWALYAENLAKQMGFFTDPYSDAGRLGAELFRAVRLVVDTGLHAKKWTREQAIDYMNENTPNSVVDNTREVERYMNWPAQALSYKVGMLEIQRLRAKAEAELGPRFDIRGFHDTVLSNGAVPLPILEELVDGWIAKMRQAG